STKRGNPRGFAEPTSCPRSDGPTERWKCSPTSSLLPRPFLEIANDRFRLRHRERIGAHEEELAEDRLRLHALVVHHEKAAEFEVGRLVARPEQENLLEVMDRALEIAGARFDQRKVVVRFGV